ncbi:glycosyltransferase [Aestuariivivens sediminis]|uniref:glycosyltransferase n=1 Tax=Aestuariivivens sediminis TaxID=2913557 RepID=UPI001F55DEA9|nr:glycosyltransferase [Aestuariivivens sediminis]
MQKRGISIIISTYRENYFNAIEQNIHESIGDVNYEIIRVDNPGVMGICSAYNLGASKAQYDMLCFVHEDVLFKTNGWGEKIISHLEDAQVGIIGIAGTAYKSKIPSSWSIYRPYTAYYLEQCNRKSKKLMMRFSYETSKLHTEVVSLDGVFLATKYSIWKDCPFDDRTFTGYHGYDMDFSMQILKNYKLFVVFDILLVHFSPGKPDISWLNAAIKFSDKWSSELPVTSIKDLPKPERLKLESQANSSFTSLAGRLGYSKLWIFKKLFRYLGFKSSVVLWK